MLHLCIEAVEVKEVVCVLACVEGCFYCFKVKTKVYTVTLREFQLFCSREDFGAFIHFCVNVSHSTKQIWGTASVLKLLLTETHSKRDLFTVAPLQLLFRFPSWYLQKSLHSNLNASSTTAVRGVKC